MDSDITIAVCKHFVDAGDQLFLYMIIVFIVWDVDGDALLRVMTDAQENYRVFQELSNILPCRRCILPYRKYCDVVNSC